MSTAVRIEPEFLRWARERSGRDNDFFRRHFKHWDQWLSGELDPSIHDIEELAETTHVPFGAFFLPSVPRVRLPIADFRIGRDGGNLTPSADLLDVIHHSQRRQAWYRDYALRSGAAPVELVGSADTSTQAEHVAGEIRDRLNFQVEDRVRLRDAGALRKYLIRAAEASGILVVATSMVENNTHRMLDPGEFRGFSLADEYAPMIFINTADSGAAQAFSFFHELAHLWRGESGVDEDNLAAEARPAVETWCNQVAAEVLVPRRDLERQHPTEVSVGTLQELRARYKCSTLVILLRLRELGYVPIAGFDALYESELERLEALGAAKEAKDNSGGDFYANQPLRVGETLSRAIIRDGLEGGTPLPEALRLLGFRQLKQFDTYAEKLGIV